jgi:ketosteroid isomerase-like protein
MRNRHFSIAIFLLLAAPVLTVATDRPRAHWSLLPQAAQAKILSTLGRNDTDSDVETKVVAMQHMWGQAYVSKDPKALERILDDAFVNVDSDGILQTKAEVVAEVRTSTAVQFLTESMEVHLHGNTAIVTGVFEIKGVDRGKPYAQRERFVDTWLYKNGQWVSIAGLVTRVGQ